MSEEVRNEVMREDDKKVWYCIKTQNRKEDDVKESLEQRRETMHIEDNLFRVIVPTVTEEVVRGKKTVEVQRKLFPGYVFVEMKMSDYSWYVVRNTKYVHGFIGSHGHGSWPTPVMESDILRILRRAGEEEANVQFTEGQKVRVISGPFEGYKSEIKSINGDIAKITVDMFGRETDLEINILDLEEVGE